jgi:FkbM family methyltransferase
MADMDHVEQLADFKVVCSSKSAFHPSLWSFLDEQDVRAKWWNPKYSGRYPDSPTHHPDSPTHQALVYDVGAAYGSYTLPALAAGCEVIAWSPPYNVPGIAFEADVLKRSALLNGFKEKSKTFYQPEGSGYFSVQTRGLWSKKGWLNTFDDRNSEWFATEQEARCVGENPIEVWAIDDIRHYTNCPDWLKIDAEGAELPILQGGARTLTKHRPKVLLENHLHLDPDCERKCFEFLQSLGVGYRRVGILPGGVISHSFYECE